MASRTTKRARKGHDDDEDPLGGDGERERSSSCPLCSALARPESAYSVPSAKDALRDVMASLTANIGNFDDDVVFKEAADGFNYLVHDVCYAAGALTSDIVRWTPAHVRTHVREHMIGFHKHTMTVQLRLLRSIQKRYAGALRIHPHTGRLVPHAAAMEMQSAAVNPAHSFGENGAAGAAGPADEIDHKVVDMFLKVSKAVADQAIRLSAFDLKDASRLQQVGRGQKRAIQSGVLDVESHIGSDDESHIGSDDDGGGDACLPDNGLFAATADGSGGAPQGGATAALFE